MKLMVWVSWWDLKALYGFQCWLYHFQWLCCTSRAILQAC
jgi:hypothetical protein